MVVVMRRRTKLAAGLEHAVHEARHPRRGRTAAVPVDRAAVLLAEPALIELADRLRDRRLQIEPRVLDSVEAVLVDGESPLHVCRHEGALRVWVRDVLAGAPAPRRAPR
jgi:hypothetical protein